MKLILSMAIALLMVAANTNAQSFNLGVKAGLNIASVDIDPEPDPNFDSKLGLHVGLLGHLHLSEFWGLQLEAMYSGQGAKLNDDAFTLNYLNVPVMLQYMFNNGFRIQAGPQLGLLLSAENIDGTDAKDDLKSIDFGLTVGASYVHVPSGFGIDARYNFGLADISDNESDLFEMKNKNFQIGVFYLFFHRD